MSVAPLPAREPEVEMKVLLAVDGSSCSDAAVDDVSRRRWPAGTVVQVVTVDAPIDPPPVRGMSSAYDELLKEKQTEAVRLMDRAAATIRERAPDLTVQTKLIPGSPKLAVVDEAERWGADLVVVGSHGHGPIRRFLLGSVSLAVAANAPCTVQIVRPKHSECAGEEAAAGA